MDNNSNKKTILKEFLNVFCIRIDNIPIFGNSTEYCGNWGFHETDWLKEEMTYTTHEGYLNFNVNGVSYLTRDCEDVRTYLESLGYKRSETRKWTILAGWYDISNMELIYPVDSHIFRLFFALSLVDKLSPTIDEGKIGKNEEEIRENIQKAYREDPIFNDELWKKSHWSTYCKKEADRSNFIRALEYIRKCIDNIGYKNVYIPETLENPEDITKIINFWRMAHGDAPDYVLSEGFIQDIPNMIKKSEEGNNYISAPIHKIRIITDEKENEDNLNFLFGPNALCNSEEELWDSLYKLINEPQKNR